MTAGFVIKKMEKIKQLAELIKKSNKIVFFGGAGVSTESGVKDYRSEDGLYNTVKEYGVSPETILSHTFFMKKTDVFYDFYRKYFITDEIMPNNAHKALAKLEEMGKLSGIVTQNIDGLHQKAGNKKIYELHGTVYKYHCMRCLKSYSLEDIRNDILKGVPKCTCGGTIKPDVVLYEEGLSEDTIWGAIRAIQEADLLIIGGTSLSVYPASSFISYFRGDNVVLINKGETFMDSRATLVFREKIGDVLMNAVKEAENEN